MKEKTTLGEWKAILSINQDERNNQLYLHDCKAALVQQSLAIHDYLNVHLVQLKCNKIKNSFYLPTTPISKAQYHK